MLSTRKLGLALALAAALGSQASLAADVALATDGQWQAFDVDNFIAQSGGDEWIDLDGAALAYTFSGPAILTVVDAGFSGDQFEVYDQGNLLGTTSDAGDSYPASVGLDFYAALADADYSRAVFVLGSGDHRITGRLLVSALDDQGMAIGATVGAVMLAPVPEPETYALMLAGLGLIGFAARRRGH